MSQEVIVKAIFPNDAAAEDTSNAYVKAFNSDGFYSWKCWF